MLKSSSFSYQLSANAPALPLPLDDLAWRSVNTSSIFAFSHQFSAKTYALPWSLADS
jgi:hypothetical protein